MDMNGDRTGPTPVSPRLLFPPWLTPESINPIRILSGPVWARFKASNVVRLDGKPRSGFGVTMDRWDAVLYFVTEARARYWVALATTSALVLFLPRPVAEALGLPVFRSGIIKGVVGGLLLLSSAFSFVGVYNLWEDKREQKSRRKRLRRHIRGLTDGEAELLREALEERQRTIYRDAANPTVRSLVEKGLLEAGDIPLDGQGVVRQGGWPHIIPDEAWEILESESDSFPTPQLE